MPAWFRARQIRWDKSRSSSISKIFIGSPPKKAGRRECRPGLIIRISIPQKSLKSLEKEVGGFQFF
jgi:hypothetical protein